MGDETQAAQCDAGRRDDQGGAAMCCVYWCREAAVVMVCLGEREHGCCRKHAAFVQAGKMDWFER
jgi:hypothetical protein